MINKRIYYICIVVLVILVMILLLNFTVFQLNDWIVRIVGIITLIDLTFIVYTYNTLGAKKS